MLNNNAGKRRHRYSCRRDLDSPYRASDPVSPNRERGHTMPAASGAPKPFQIVAAVIGNALEWYDFIVFGFFTVIIARLFFPADSQYASLLLTTATFGVGFFMRPVGGILLGIYADRRGRKASLLLIIGLMTLAIAMIGLAPTYAAIGVAAPALIVIARLLQGFSAGGEFASSTAFLIESAPPQRRGFYGSWQMVGQGLAVLTGALLGALITRALSPEAIESWGWRVPFLFGLVIGPLGLYIRRRLDETTAFLASRRADQQKKLGTALRVHFRQALATFGLIICGTISFYVILLYMPTFARTQLHLPLDQAFSAQAISLACMIVLIPIFGALSDHIGRRPIMVGALILYFVLSYPLFSWMYANPSFSSLIVVQILLCSLLGAFFGPMSTASAEQFQVHVRSTGLGIAYNLAVMIFGGFAPFFVTWLIQVTGLPVAPAFYVMFGAAAGLLASLFLKERARDAELMVTDAEIALN
jgi:MFS transporter, MHS family, proline/betaine transporter